MPIHIICSGSGGYTLEYAIASYPLILHYYFIAIKQYRMADPPPYMYVKIVAMKSSTKHCKLTINGDTLHSILTLIGLLLLLL